MRAFGEAPAPCAQYLPLKITTQEPRTGRVGCDPGAPRPGRLPAHPHSQPQDSRPRGTREKGPGGSEGNPGASGVASARPHPPWVLVSPVSNGEIASSSRLLGGARRSLEQEGGTSAEDPWGL